MILLNVDAQRGTSPIEETKSVTDLASVSGDICSSQNANESSIESGV